MTEQPGTAAVKADTAPHPDDPRKPQSPTEITTPSWRYTAKAAWAEFNRDQCTDLAAALTYYAVLSLFPAMIALVSLLGVFGEGRATTETMLDLLRQMGAGDIAEQLRGPIQAMVDSPAAGIGLVTGLAGALWSASGYVGAFARAMNRVFEVDEGRGTVKLRAQQLGLTTALLLLTALILLGLVVSGPIAETLGGVIGLGSQSVTVWNWAKWPVILAFVIVIVAVLYYATPNVRQPRLRWASVGATVAIAIWILASVGFGFYVTNFGKYNNPTYGSLGGAIVFLLWLWLTNVALLFGAEIDAELERARQLQAGIKAERTLQLPPRDTTASEKAARALARKVEAGKKLRLSQGGSAEAPSPDSDRPSYAADWPELEPLPSERGRARKAARES